MRGDIDCTPNFLGQEIGSRPSQGDGVPSAQGKLIHGYKSHSSYVSPYSHTHPEMHDHQR